MAIKRSGNRFTGATNISAREEDTIRSCMRKIIKIAGKDRLDMAQLIPLNDAYLALRDALVQAGRWEE